METRKRIRAGLGATIYLITFPPWRGASRTGTEPPAGHRSRRMTFADLSVAVGFGLTTAHAHHRLLRARARA